MPQSGLDPSWQFGMNQAVAQKFVFGQDIIFTFGPYASIYTRLFHPSTDHLMMFGSMYIAIFFTIVAFLDFRKSTWILKLLFLIFLSIAHNVDSLLFSYPLMVGVYVLNIKNFELDKKQYIILIILFSVFGLLPLVKGSLLLGCVGISVLCSIYALGKGNWKFIVIVFSTSIVSMCFFWVFSGQPLVALPMYFKSMSSIIDGYTEAMSVFGSRSEIFFFILGSLIIIYNLSPDIKTLDFRKTTIVFIFFFILFLAFKAGFVRHDGHANISGTTLLFAAILSSTLISRKNGFLVLSLSLFSFFYIKADYGKINLLNLFMDAQSTYVNSYNGIKQRIFAPQALKHDFDRHIVHLREEGGIPHLDGTTDIYSVEQSYLIASLNEWNPRPILQSYSVYMPDLAERNKAHLVGDNHPNNVIFKIQPIDHRMPAIEDGNSWPTLLANYEPTSIINERLYLKNRLSKRDIFYKKINLGKNEYSFGENINLPNHHGLIFLKININKNFLGKIFNAIFKVSRINIKINLENGQSKIYTMIPNMVKTGFVLSPLVENTRELGLLFAGARYLDNKKIRSISIDSQTSVGRIFWNNHFQIELNLMEYNEIPQYINLYSFQRPSSIMDFPNEDNTSKCYGNIDTINNISPVPRSLEMQYLLEAHGWLAISTKTGELPDKIYLTFVDESGKRYFVETKQRERQDVALFFGNSKLKYSGYEVFSNISELSGEYALRISYLKNGYIHFCKNFNVKVLVGGVIPPENKEVQK